MILRIGSNAVIVALPHQVIILVVHRDLSGNHVPVLLRNFRHVKLVPKCSRQRHDTACLKGRDTPHRMVRAVRDMRPHRRQRVQQRGSLLYLETLDCVRVIRAPYLRAKIQHTRVKTCTAARTVFQQEVRKFLCQPVLHLVHRKHIAVVKLTLPVRRESVTADVRKLPVHIPLDILDVGAPEHGCHLLIHAVHNLLP